MHRVVPTSLSLTIIAVAAIFVAAFSIVRNHNLMFPATNQTLAMMTPSKKAVADSTTCKAHAFQGSASVSAWKVMKDDKALVQVAAKDVSKLPANNIDSFELIDATSEIEKKLDSSSEKKPVKLALSGFATRCDGTALACLSYKDGIFKPYLSN